MKKLNLFLLLAFFAGVTLNAATQYCHESKKDQSNNEYFITIKTTGTNTYQVIVEGSETATITEAYNINCGMNGGIDMSNGTWIYNPAGFGSMTRTFTYSGTPGVAGANDITLKKSTSTGSGDLLFAKLPTDADWTATCSAAPAEDDTEAPVMTSASLVSNTHNSAVIAVVATDNVGVTKYVVYNNAAKQGEYTPSDGKITVTGLTPSTSYTLTIKAKDAAGNESTEGKDVAFTTNGDPKADNTQCKGWNDDMWASEGGYTYDFSTTATDVVLKITAIGEFPPEMAASPQILFTRSNGGDGFESGGVVSGKTITWTFSKTGVLTRDDNPYLFSDNTIHFKPYIARRSGVDQTNEIIYTVGEDCQEPGPTPELTDPELTIKDPSAAIELAIDATQQITWTSLNTATPTFTSSKESVATVSDAGVITAKAIGSATITVKQEETDTYQEATKTITVTVVGDKSKNTECSGWDNEKTDGTKTDLGYNYKFTTEGTSVKVEIEFLADFTGMVGYMWDETSGFAETRATVNGKEVIYTFTNKTSGDALKFRIKLEYAGGGMTVTKQFTYHVGEDCQPHSVTGVSITSEFTEIEVNQSKTMTAEVSPFNATNKKVSWSITSGSDKATINSSGTLTAGDAEGSVTVQVKTEDGGYTATKTITVVAAKPTAPSALPTAPTLPAEQVKAVYSATYNADCSFGAWSSDTEYLQEEYGKKFTIHSSGYFGLENFSLNCSQMEYLHADVWVKDNKSIRFVPIHTSCDDQVGVTKNLTGGQWNSIDIPISDFKNGDDWSNVNQLKIDQVSNQNALWFNNIYFYTTKTKTICALSASVKNNEGGTASVDNAEVTKGGSATFTAVADCGYSFVGWWNNTTKVSEDATYTQTNIQEDLSLVAEFAFVGPSEAATVKTYDQMISIYGVGTPITGVTMNPYWEDATQKNMISVAGKQMWKYSTINYFGIDFDGNRQDVSAMKYIHLDIWSNASGEIKFYLIWNGGESPVTVQLVGGQWNSINIPLTNWSTENLKTIRQLKFNAKKTEIGDNGIEGATILVQDIFFYAPNEFTLSEEDDNTENLTTFNGKVCDVTIDRTFNADGFNYTLCLPFDMTADQCLDAFGEGYKLFLMGNAYMKTTDVMYLPFSAVTSIEAGKPYLFCPAADVVNPTIEGVTINAADPVAQGNNFATMTGIYSPTIVAASNYVLGDDNWLYQSDGGEMYGLRCYFTFGSAAPAGVRARAVFHNTDVVTDLETIDGVQCTMHDGKYVINGQFVIIRNGKRYNAMGQMD